MYGGHYRRPYVRAAIFVLALRLYSRFTFLFYNPSSLIFLSFGVRATAIRCAANQKQEMTAVHFVAAFAIIFFFVDFCNAPIALHACGLYLILRLRILTLYSKVVRSTDCCKSLMNRR